MKTIYAAGPTIPRLISNTVDAVQGRASTVYVTNDSDGISVAISIGVDSAESAEETCREVYRTVAEHLGALGTAVIKEIRVSIGSIN